MTTIKCGSLIFTSEFDSGNLLRAELVSEASDVYGISNQARGTDPDYEVNLWTRPDCYGTKFENGNRTWFYFGVRGGKPQALVKYNVLNLNRQLKLFMQGMQPVFRVLPGNPTWERCWDKVVLNETGEHLCSITFRHRLPQDPEATLFIAFTYPFSHLELCDMLQNMDEEYMKKRSTLPVKHCSSSPSLDRKNTILPTLGATKEDDIYYHRECVTYSLLNRRVDLITVSSYHGISTKREERLTNLFPHKDEPRPFKFPGKKVVFVSARVHPGETSSSFVLNGFLKFILQRTDRRALLLRRLFVFKLIPSLNPDGVAAGHYRTDPRGTNLNRVYLNPSPVLHPTIYAARKLLLFYHCGRDAPDDYEYPVDPDLESSVESSRPTNALLEAAGGNESNDSFGSFLRKQNDRVEKEKEEKRKKQPYTFVLSDKNSLCAGCGPFKDESAGGTEAIENLPEDVQAGCSTNVKPDVNANHQCEFEACDEDSVFYENLKPTNLNDVSDDTSSSKQNAESPPPKGTCSVDVVNFKNITPMEGVVTNAVSVDAIQKKKGGSTMSLRSQSKKAGTSTGSGVKKNGNNTTLKKKASSLDFIENKTKKVKRGKKIVAPSSSDIKQSPVKERTGGGSSMEKLLDFRTLGRLNESESGLFIYVDLHGHTTKRGIFMYGNHFNDISTQVECMLMPRLMAVNSQHFDFSACNFTERLMCMKDRRDGASREGSGRVACHKLTGLIRSYTLECNYNTGRMVNHIISRPASFGFVDPPPYHSPHPPKFNIETYEGVGKAMAESILDLTGHNPWSRLTFSEFKSLEGLRKSLVRRLKTSPEYRMLPPEISPKKSMPMTNCAIDPFAVSNALNSLKSGNSSKALPKVLSPTAGPLGPRRENQAASPIAKASGSQLKRISLGESSSLLEPATSSSSSGFSGQNSALPVKPSLKKSLKTKKEGSVSVATKRRKKSKRASGLKK